MERGQPIHFKETYNCSKKSSKNNNSNNHREETTLNDYKPEMLSNYLQDAAMIRQLEKNGISSLFPIQQACFKVIAKGYDLTARDRTGSGKTLAYALPALDRLRKKELFNGNNPKVMVMVPTRELALQVTTTFEKVVVPDWKARVVAVYGGDGLNKQMEMIKRGCDIVVATPGRLIDFINRGVMQFKDLRCLILDEADEMLKQGFQRDIENIFQAVMKATETKPQTLLFSATIPGWVKDISNKYQEPKCTYIDLIGNTQVSVPKTIRHFKYPIYNFNEIR